MNLNEAYAAYTKDPSWLNKEVLGDELLTYCTVYFRKYGGGIEESLRRVRSYQTMKDALGDAILEIWERLPKYNPQKASFKTWVTTILNNSFIDGYKKYAKTAEVSMVDDPIVHPHRSIDDKLTLKQAMQTLSKPEQEFLKMHFAGFSDKAKGEHFGKNTKWSDNQLQIIKKKMRSFVVKKG
jgi:RNA polymerase sigma-70 factor, ECF subfamily